MGDFKIKTLLQAVHKFLTNKLTILIFYLSVIGLRFVYSVVLQKSTNMTLVSLSALVIYCLFAFGTFKGVKVVTWIMAFCLLFSGIGGLVIGSLFIPLNQYILKFFFVIAGSYFVYGGLFLLFPNWKIFGERGTPPAQPVQFS